MARSTLFLLRSVLLACLVLVLNTAPAIAKRVALVVGNSAYENAPSLPNPRNDAEAIAASLNGLGFEVFSGFDLTREAFETLIRDFVVAADTADAAVLFYAGHGLEVDGTNFLIPVDANIRAEADLIFQALNFSNVLKLMETKRRTNLVFLDACRDNPIVQNLADTMGTRSTSVGRGLAPIETGVGTLIAYATQPGNVAYDGVGQHSPFTKALLRHIETPGLDVEILMRRVRREVMSETDGLQVPWSSSSLTGGFTFLKPGQVPEQSATQSTIRPVTPTADGSTSEGDDAEPGKQASVERQNPPEPPTYVKKALATPDKEDTPETKPEPEVALSQKELVTRSQAALNRLGCRAGAEDGIWGNQSRRALEKLAEHDGSFEVAALEPTVPLLLKMESVQNRICPLECLATEREEAGACVRKTCPSGQKLSSKGQCYTPTARKRSKTKGSGTRHCFTMNGQTFCE